MSVTQTAAALFQLQQLDFELDRLTAEQQAVARALQGDGRLQQVRAEHTAAQQQLQHARQAQKEAEWSLEDMNLRLSTQEQRLYGGNIVHPKELHALQQEMQKLQAQQGPQEELIYELMGTTEVLEETVQHKAVVIQQAEAAWQQESETLLIRREQLEARRQELQTKRAQTAARIDADLLQRYDTLRRIKQGRAVSKIEQGSCQWCRVILTPSELQHVRMNTALQTCTNCGRILYYDR